MSIRASNRRPSILAALVMAVAAFGTPAPVAVSQTLAAEGPWAPAALAQAVAAQPAATPASAGDPGLDRALDPQAAVVLDPAAPGWATYYGTELGRALLPARQAPASFASALGAEPALTGTWRTTVVFSSTSGVTAIAYAPDGRLFAGVTNSGLRTWGPDANGIFGWTTILSSSTGLPSNAVSALAIFNGDLYVGTNLGVGVYDLATNTWARLTVGNSSLPGNDVHRFTPINNQSGADYLWISTNAGAAKYTPPGRLAASWNIINTADGLPDNYIYDVAEFPTLFGITTYFANSIEVTSWDGASAFAPVSGSADCLGGLRRATRLLTTSRGDLWALQQENVAALGRGFAADVWTQAGVCRYHSTGIFTYGWDYYTAASPGLPSNLATDASEDFAGRVWLSFNGAPGGGAVWDNGTWKMFTPPAAPLFTANVGSVLAAGEAVWFGHYDSAAFSIYSPNWRRFPFTAASQQPGPLYSELTRTWAGLGNALGWIDAGAWLTATVPGNASTILALQRGGDGNLWLGTAANGAIAYNPASTTAYTKASGLPSNSVLALTSDSQGRLWAGTSAGLAMRAQGGYWLTFTAQTSGLLSDTVTALAVDSADKLWIGTPAGLSVYDLLAQGGAWLSYTVGSGLPSNKVNALAAHPSGGMWVGTDAGLSAWNPVSLTWTTYTSATGVLPGNRVTHVSIDPLGRVWAATANGLALRQGASWQKFFPPGTMVESNRITGLAADANRTWVAASGATGVSGTIAARGVLTSPIGNAVPAITGFSPGQGAPGDTLVITGTGFDARGPEFNTVRFCCVDGPSGTPAPQGEIQAVTYSAITVTVPPGVSTGQLQVDANGLHSPLSAASFKLKPKIIGFTPACIGLGGLVTVNGAGFMDGSGAAYVKLGAGAERVADATDPLQVRTFLRPGDTSGKIVVRLTNGLMATSTASLSVPVLSINQTLVQQSITGLPMIWGKRTLVQIDARSTGACADAVTSALVQWRFAGNQLLNGGSFSSDAGKTVLKAGGGTGDGFTPLINVVANVDMYDAASKFPYPAYMTPLQAFLGARITLKRNGIQLTQYDMPASAFNFIDTNGSRRKVRIMSVFPSDVASDPNHDQNLWAGMAAMARVYPQQDDSPTWGPYNWAGITPIYTTRPFSILIGTNDDDARNAVDDYLDPSGQYWGVAAIDANLTGKGSAGGVSSSGWRTVSIDADKDVSGRYMAHELMHAFGFVDSDAANYENVPVKGGDHHSRYDEGRWNGNAIPFSSCDGTRRFKDALDAQSSPGAKVVRLDNTGAKLMITAACNVAASNAQSGTAKSVISYAPNRDNFNVFMEPEDYRNLLAQLCVTWLGPFSWVITCPGYSDPNLPVLARSVQIADLDALSAVVTRTLRLSGQIGAGDAVTPSISYVAVDDGAVTPQEPSGDYHLIVRDGASIALHDQRFALPDDALLPHDLSASGLARDAQLAASAASGPFNLRVPFPLGAVGAEIVHAGNTLWSASVSAHAPTVSVPSLSGSVIDPNLPMTVTWSGGDADADSLQYGIDYSADGGATWIVVAPHVFSTTLAFVPNLLPAGATSRVRVRVSDGFNTAGAQSALFTLQHKTPEALIDTPSDGAILGEGLLVALSGGGLGSGGFNQPGFVYAWKADGKPVASGMVATTTLSGIGVHTITLAVGDGALTGTRTVSVTVVADYDGDGLPNAWEQKYGLNPLDPTDAAADPDGDGLANAQEYLNGTNPLLPDTDADGYNDGIELATGTDPLDPLNMPIPVPVLKVGSTSMGFTYNTYSPANDPKSTWVTNQGAGSFIWTATASAPWITLPVPSATAPTPLTVTTSALGKALGIYTGVVTVTAPGALLSPQIISITMHVEQNVYPSTFLPSLRR